MGFSVGTEVTLNPSSVVCGDKAIYVYRGKSIFVEMVPIASVAEYREKKAREWESILSRPPAPDPRIDGEPLDGDGSTPREKTSAFSSALRSRLGLDPPDKDPPAGTETSAEAPPSAADSSGDDVRTLWVITDEQGVRFKPWKDVVVESWHSPFGPGEGQKLRGPSTVVQFLRAMDPDPRSWLEKWRQLKKLEINDRVMHELTPLVESIYLGGCYDCLNMPSLVAFEFLVRRIYQVTDAYAVPGKISWANSKYFRGTSGIDEIVPQEMRSYVHRESRAEVELAAARSRTASLAGGMSPATGSSGDGLSEGDGGFGPTGGDAPAAPRGKGGGRKGGGKGGGRMRNAQPATPGP